MGCLSQYGVPEQPTLPQGEGLELEGYLPDGVVPELGPTELRGDKLGLLGPSENSSFF